jgi:hypothetical protein
MSSRTKVFLGSAAALAIAVWLGLWVIVVTGH